MTNKAMGAEECACAGMECVPSYCFCDCHKKRIKEIADKLWEDCKGASKANAIPFIIEALQLIRQERK